MSRIGSSRGRLEGREPPERAVGELGVAADRLHRDDERVAAEQGEEPRDARRRDVDAALEGRVLEVERLEVADGLRPRAPDGLVGRPDGDRGGSRSTPAIGSGTSTALQGRTAGRLTPKRVIGSHDVQACHTPLGAISATNSSRPFAYCARASERSTVTMSSRRKSPLTYTVRSSWRDGDHPVSIVPRRTMPPPLTSKMSAKSEVSWISIARWTGRRA